MTLQSNEKTTTKEVSSEKVTGKKVVRKKAARAEYKPKVESKAKAKVESKAKPKIESKAKPKVESKAKPKVESKASKTATPKVAKKAKKTPRIDAQAIKIAMEERWEMIASVAYIKAEKRGFAPGGEKQDWNEAEKEVDKLISG
jgi:hypothetical protein